MKLNNTYWAEHFKHLGKDTTAAVDQVLRSFSQVVDDCIEEANSSWIRIRGQKSEGMFDYDFSEAEAAELYLRFHSIIDHSQFVDACIDLLWERTEQLLVAVRKRITGELRSRLTETLASTERTINKVLTENEQDSEFVTRIAQARTKIHDGTRIVSEWFTISTANVIEEFDFELLINAVAEITRRIHRGVDFRPECVLAETATIDGRWFTPFADLVSNLFDNIVRHSHTENFRPQVSIETRDGRLHLSVANALGESVDTAALSTLATTFSRQTSDEKLQTEGGTGFVKVHNLIRHDLLQSDYKVICKVDEHQRFVVTIDLPAAPFIGVAPK